MRIRTAVALLLLMARAVWRAIWRESAVALGLVPLILARPLADGVTYVTDNFYFTWGIIILFTLWGCRTLMRGEPIRFGWPLVLLGGYLAVAVLSITTTVQFDLTYRGIILWSGYFFLFVLATNALRTRTAQTIVLAAICASMFIESVWGLIHFKYVLPLVREQVSSNPQLFKVYFGDATPGPELVHRIMVNRAFGSLLFPNSLAAFLILGIPYVFCEAVRSLKAIRTRVPGALRSGAGTWTAILSGIGVWFIVFCLGYVVVRTGLSHWYPVDAGVARFGFLLQAGTGYTLAETGYVVWWASLLLLLPAVAGGSISWILLKRGWATLGLLIRVLVLPVLVVLQLILLWLTFSRGGWLALAVACASMLVLFFVADRRFASVRKMAAAALILLLVSVSWATLASADSNPSEAPPSNALSREGIDLSATDLANPESFHLRLTYWQTGLKMAWHNPWLGVGLGNFGTVYPQYQAVGAGPSKAAHNDYLQAFCETGVLGFALFCAFWAYFMYWGARRIWNESDKNERLILAGLYAGVVAFLVHALVDFNFCNPALNLFVFLLAGLFYARGASTTPGAGWNFKYHRIVALGLVVLAPIVAAMALRVYLSDYIVGDRQIFHVKNNFKLNRIFEAGEFFVHDAPESIAQKKAPVKDMRTVTALIPDRTVLHAIGSIRVPDPEAPKRHRALGVDEAIPSSAFFVVTKPEQAKREAARQFELWLDELGHADAIFPYNPELACYYVQWYDMLLGTEQNEEEKRECSANMLKWAEAAVARSPRQFVYREWLAKAYWVRATVEPGARRREFFEKGLEQYKKAVELYPISGKTWKKYGDALIKFGEALTAAGDKSAGETQINEGKRALERAEKLAQRGGKTE